MRFVWILLGGGAGSVCRYALSRALFNPGNDFPMGTFAVNVLGCLLIGILARYLSDESMRLLWITGFLGGFTTFSSFGLETITLLRNGETGTAIAYASLSNFVGLAAVWAGWRAANLTP